MQPWKAGRMRRVSVVGVPGSGKSTFGHQLAARLGAPHVELDSIFHQPGWTPLPVDEFRARVEAVTAGDAWVIDGNYRTAISDLVWQRADTVIWLDLPRSIVMPRIVRRTWRRAIRRERLWNGNREPLRNLYRLDPEKSIIRWAWVKHPEYRQRYGRAMVDPAFEHLRFVRLRSPREVEAFLAEV